MTRTSPLAIARTNWWIPDRACVEAMLPSAGFRIAASPEEEVYACEPAGAPEHER